MTERPEKHNRDGCTGKDGLAMREDELVMVDRVKVGGFAPPPSSCWDNFTIMISGHCHSVYSVFIHIMVCPEPVFVDLFKESRNRFPAWRAGTTTLFVVRQAT